MGSRITVMFLSVIMVTLMGMVISSFETASLFVNLIWWGAMGFVLLQVWTAQQAESSSARAASVVFALVPVLVLISLLTWCEANARAMDDHPFLIGFPLVPIICACGAFIGVACLNGRAEGT